LVDQFLSLNGGLRIELDTRQSNLIFKRRLSEVMNPATTRREIGYLGLVSTWWISNGGMFIIAETDGPNYTTDHLFEDIERELTEQELFPNLNRMTQPLQRIEYTYISYPVATSLNNYPTQFFIGTKGYHQHLIEFLEIPFNTITETYPSLKKATGEELEAIGHEFVGLTRTINENDDDFRARLLARVQGVGQIGQQS